MVSSRELSRAVSGVVHDENCRQHIAATCAVGIECEHGYDACPICDRCTCGPFQPRVEPWMRECFGDVIPLDREERGDRLLEEVFELLQSGGYDPARVLALRDYVWGRDVGEPAQELGGVMVTLAAYSLAFKLEMHEAGETELARIWTKVPQIRAKQASKPTGSALPIAVAGTTEHPPQSRDDPDTLASSYVDLEGVGLGPLTQPSVIDVASSSAQSGSSCEPVTEAAASLEHAIPTTCVETLGGDPDTAIRLSFQIKVF